jgi:outer membrane protein
MKRFVLLPALLCGMLFTLFAQQSITRFAVVDVGRIIQTFVGTMDDAKAYTEKRERIQAEINRLTRELQELNTKLSEAIKEDDKSQIRDLERQFESKRQAVQLYITTSQAELDKDLEKVVTNNNTFKTQLNNALRYVAESEGYSMVLSKQEASGILWYSPSVDITSKVIERLRSPRR